MKNRRLVLVAFLLCACMIVGVGYAALAVELKVDGNASFHTNTTTGLEENVHFTGNAVIMAKDAESGSFKPVTTKETDVAIIGVNYKETDATLDINLIASEHEDYIVDGKYRVVVYYEFEVKADATELKVNMGGVAVNMGTAANQGTFVVTSQVMNAARNAVVTGEQTVDATETKTYWLEVVVELATANAGSDIADTEFHVVLPVTKVETPTNA